MRHGNVLHLIKIFLLLWNIIFNHSLGVWTSVHYNTHASPATALHWLYLSQRGGRHSQWARCHSLDGFSSTHTLLILSDDENIRQGSTKPFPDSTKLLRTQRMERTSKKGLSTPAIGSCSTTPMGSTTPMQFISMGSTTPMGHSCGSFCIVYLLICELHFQLFQTLAVLSRGVATSRKILIKCNTCFKYLEM